MAPSIEGLEQRVVERLGSVVDEQALANPHAARRLLLAAFKAKRLQTRYLPERRQPAWGRLVSRIALEDMVGPLDHPQRSVLTSIFMPTELFRAAGLLPYAAEAVAGFFSAACAEQAFITEAEGSGIAETYCSFHKTLIGAERLGVIEAPELVASCSLACDANSLTFKRLAGDWGVARSFIDVPYEVSEDSVSYVAEQFRDLAALLESLGHPVDRTRLTELCASGQRSLSSLAAGLPLRRGRFLRTTMGQEMQAALALHLSLGRPGVERMCTALLEELRGGAGSEGTGNATRAGSETPGAGPRAAGVGSSGRAGNRTAGHAGADSSLGGLNLVWMHIPPFFQEPLQEMLDNTPGCQIVASDMCYDVVGGMAREDALESDAGESEPVLAEPAAGDPFAFMARRLVYNAFNGPAERRIARVLNLAHATGADGVVCFCQWGCKHTLGLSQMAKARLEAQGFPTLVLEGDGCNHANTSNGQVATRMGAFLEMLRSRRQTA